MKQTSLTLILATILMLIVSTPSANAQKVVLHMTGNKTFECNISELDSISFDDATDGNVKFVLQSNQTSTTRSPEDSNDHTQGTANEYKVNTARVYLFDSNTKLFVKTFSLTNITQAGSDENYNIKYTADKVKVPQGKFDIFVVANTDRVIDKDTEE
ncbi:MAG: FimB/Mfa2 family fimbrial subunit, partial [Bacteroidaceae bacterium]|nr:FimB/Mfa2 family fimbrial subunit [Bacteroidaceae bacterium]